MPEFVQLAALGRPFAIGIAGLSGSGKSALARKLAPLLPGGCEIIALDSYYFAQSHLPLEQRAGLNYDHPDSLDWRLLETHMSEIVRGRSIEAPVYSFAEHTRAAETHTVHPAPCLILEGILALHDARVRSTLDLAVFVDTQGGKCFDRRLRRDIAERGRTRESVLEQYETTVWPMAVEFVLPSRKHADLTVSGEDPIDLSVASVLEMVTALRATNRMAAGL